jgi:hypothetical protein
MRRYLDSSVLVASLMPDDPDLHTINLGDFHHLHREGDPEIRRP